MWQLLNQRTFCRSDGSSIWKICPEPTDVQKTWSSADGVNKTTMGTTDTPSLLLLDSLEICGILQNLLSKQNPPPPKSSLYNNNRLKGSWPIFAHFFKLALLYLVNAVLNVPISVRSHHKFRLFPVWDTFAAETSARFLWLPFIIPRSCSFQFFLKCVSKPKQSRNKLFPKSKKER